MNALVLLVLDEPCGLHSLRFLVEIFGDLFICRILWSDVCSTRRSDIISVPFLLPLFFLTSTVKLLCGHGVVSIVHRCLEWFDFWTSAAWEPGCKPTAVSDCAHRHSGILSAASVINTNLHLMRFPPVCLLLSAITFDTCTGSCALAACSCRYRQRLCGDGWSPLPNRPPPQTVSIWPGLSEKDMAGCADIYSNTSMSGLYFFFSPVKIICIPATKWGELAVILSHLNKEVYCPLII